MQEDQYWYNKSSQEKIYADLQHEANMNYLHIKQELALFESLKPKLSKDGDHWCVLYGEDLQVGISGFGKTPFEAILNFNKEFNQTT